MLTIESGNPDFNSLLLFKNHNKYRRQNYGFLYFKKASLRIFFVLFCYFCCGFGLGGFLCGFGFVSFFLSRIATNTTVVTKTMRSQAQDGLKNRYMLKSHLLKETIYSSNQFFFQLFHPLPLK